MNSRRQPGHAPLSHTHMASAFSFLTALSARSNALGRPCSQAGTNTHLSSECLEQAGELEG
jgi:hypothetical protein